jgi:hypothetical protein
MIQARVRLTNDFPGLGSWSWAYENGCPSFTSRLSGKYCDKTAQSPRENFSHRYKRAENGLDVNGVDKGLARGRFSSTQGVSHLILCDAAEIPASFFGS